MSSKMVVTKEGKAKVKTLDYTYPTPKKYKVWECKIVVPANAKLPSGFDRVPRSAAQEAVADAGIEVITTFSGWGGSLDAIEQEMVEKDDALYT